MNSAGKTLSYGEQKALVDKIQDLKDASGGKELVQGVNMSSPNVQKNRQELRRLEGILSSQGIFEISAKERTAIEAEEKLLREDLQKGMPSWDRYVASRPKDGPRHDKMVSWITQTDGDPIRSQKVRRWKTLRRYLFPLDPKASHTMHLFPE